MRCKKLDLLLRCNAQICRELGILAFAKKHIVVIISSFHLIDAVTHNCAVREVKWSSLNCIDLSCRYTRRVLRCVMTPA